MNLRHRTLTPQQLALFGIIFDEDDAVRQESGQHGTDQYSSDAETPEDYGDESDVDVQEIGPCVIDLTMSM